MLKCMRPMEQKNAGTLQEDLGLPEDRQRQIRTGQVFDLRRPKLSCTKKHIS